MLQMFHVDVAKVNRDVAYVALVVPYVANFCSNVTVVFSDAYCKCVYLNIAYVSHICVANVYLDVVYVLRGFQVFLGVLHRIHAA
jgi:hypothetical protein